LDNWYGGTILKTTTGGVILNISGYENFNANSFHLFQNYPNPFNPATKISFYLPKFSSVIIKVLNINGQEISTILNTKKIIGTHEIEFDGTDLPSGIYFYKIVTDYFIESRKMILLK